MIKEESKIGIPIAIEGHNRNDVSKIIVIIQIEKYR